MRSETEIRALVRGPYVHSDTFTDPEIFELELDRIFSRRWVYVAHESEIPEPGDYCVRTIGRQSMIVSRGPDGAVRVLANRCRHRGGAVCQLARGTSRFFRCHYHGWTYDAGGRLVGVPYPDGYDESFSTEDFGLSEAAGVEVYRGLIFTCLLEVPRPLVDDLGPTTLAVLDAFLDASPTGSVEVARGVQRVRFRGNWKYVGMDGYHPNFTHRSLQDIQATDEEARRRLTGMNADSSPSRTVDLGHGHVRIDQNPAFEQGEKDLLRTAEEGGVSPEAAAAYLDALRERYGDDAPAVLTRARDPHLHIWPGLQVVGSHFRRICPVAPDVTEVELYCTLLPGAGDEVNAARVAGHVRFYGPSGLGQPDDSEMFERNQVGLGATVDPWLYVGRGMHREVTDEDGRVWGHITDEVTQRGQMQAWLDAMVREPAPTAAEARR